MPTNRNFDPALNGQGMLLPLTPEGAIRGLETEVIDGGHYVTTPSELLTGEETLPSLELAEELERAKAEVTALNMLAGANRSSGNAHHKNETINRIEADYRSQINAEDREVEANT